MDIFIIGTLMLGLDPWGSAIILVTIGMIVVNLLGMMHFWNITLNAVSLVNLVMVKCVFKINFYTGHLNLTLN